MRPRFQWDLGSRTLTLGERTLIMGVLNVTPDSFSDGGRYLAPQAAIAHGLALLDQGADILDIGGESTRPGASTSIHPPPAAPSLSAPAVSAEEELARVLPIIQAIKRQRPASILSIDTYKSMVARQAIRAGAEIVNDVSGFTWDAAMPHTIAELSCGAILMHVRGLPHQWRTQPPAPHIVSLVREELRVLASHALDAGIARSSLVLDPGFGFGKNFDENYPLLAHFADFQSLGFPLLAAVSRKSFLAHTLSVRLNELAGAAKSGAPHLPQLTNVLTGSAEAPDPSSLATVEPQARDTATLAASVAAALTGAHIVRLHTVPPAIEALAIADAILRAE